MQKALMEVKYDAQSQQEMKIGGLVYFLWGVGGGNYE